MIARAAEANPSCFSRSGLADPISEVIPKLLRVVSSFSFPSLVFAIHELTTSRDDASLSLSSHTD